MKIVTSLPRTVTVPADLIPSADAKPAEFYAAKLEDPAAVSILRYLAGEAEAGAVVLAPNLPNNAVMSFKSAMIKAKELPAPQIKMDEAIPLPNGYTAVCKETGGVDLYFGRVGCIAHTDNLQQAAVMASDVKRPRFVKNGEKFEPIPATFAAMQAAMRTM
jgi:hypothetical protein